MALRDVIIGHAKGDKGDKGDTGERGPVGQTGPQGEPGNIADAEITDTQGLDVAKEAKTTAQKLFDAIADRIVNKLVTNDTLTTKLADYLLKSAMSSTNINSTTNVPTSALVYSLLQDVNSNLVDSKKLVQVVTNDHGLFLGYDNTGLYSVVDLTRVDIAQKADCGKSIYATDLFADYLVPTFVQWNGATLNTPYKLGLTYEGEGFALVFGTKTTWQTVVVWSKGSANSSGTWVHTYNSGNDNGWGKYTVTSV